MLDSQGEQNDMSDTMIMEGAKLVYAKIEYDVPFNEIHVEVTPLFAEELLASLATADLPGMRGEHETPSHILRLKSRIFEFIRKAQFDYHAPEPAIRFFIKEDPK